MDENQIRSALRPSPTAPAGNPGVAESDWVGKGLILRSARNEWVDGFIRLAPGEKKAEGREIRVSALNVSGGEGRIEAARIRPYRVETVAIETRSVSAIRDSGPALGGAEGESASLPRALIPLEGDLVTGVWRVPAGVTLLYVEVKAPLSAVAGVYEGNIELRTPGRDPERIGLQLTVDDLALSDVPSFSLYGEVRWEDLLRLFPRQFGAKGTPEPRLLTRKDGRNVLATERLDQIVRLCRAHRLDVGFTRLQPTVKYTPRDGLLVDWEDYDSLVVPWLTGEIDPSKEGLSAFPMPVPEEVRRGAVSPAEFMRAAMGHFDQQRLLGKMLLPPGIPESALGTGDLADKVRRPGEMVSLPTQSEEGLRQVAWQAFAERRGAARAGEVSPSVGSPSEPETATRAVWFYPGEWFGAQGERGGIVPSIGVKWARRAQQDREILELARRRGAEVLAQTVVRRATRYGERSPKYGGELLTPVASPAVWNEGLRIVRGAAVARAPGEPPVGEAMLEEEREATQRWSQSLDAPLLLPATVAYRQDAGQVRVTADVELVDETAEVNVLRAPEGWTQVNARRRQGGMTIDAVLDPSALRYPVTPAVDERGNALPPHGTLRLEVVSGPDRARTERDILVPASAVLPSPRAPELDGKLGDWTDEELVHTGALVRMLDRYSVQTSATPRSAKETSILARWDGRTLYLALRADGTAPLNAVATNFTREEKGRAFGEDLYRLTIARAGVPELRLLLKPGSITAESGGARGGAPNVRYASTLEKNVWRAELAIPAEAFGGTLINGETLEFNLVRHDTLTGESASFAGPVDQDYQPLRGALVLVERRPGRR